MPVNLNAVFWKVLPGKKSMAIYGNLQPPEMLENMKYIDISSENTARICWNDIYRIPQVSLETSKDAGLPIFQHIVRLRPLKACGTCRNVCCLEWMSLYIACSPVLFGKYPQAIWQSHGKIWQNYPPKPCR